MGKEENQDGGSETTSVPDGKIFICVPPLSICLISDAL